MSCPRRRWSRPRRARAGVIGRRASRSGRPVVLTLFGVVGDVGCASAAVANKFLDRLKLLGGNRKKHLCFFPIRPVGCGHFAVVYLILGNAKESSEVFFRLGRSYAHRKSPFPERSLAARR